MTDSRAMAIKAARAAESKNAADVVVLELRGISLIADYFVIGTGRSSTQVQAISRQVEEELVKEGAQLLRREGYRDSGWILLDFGSVVVHIMREEQRRFYDLERLWGDASRVNWREEMQVVTVSAKED